MLRFPRQASLFVAAIVLVCPIAVHAQTASVTQPGTIPPERFYPMAFRHMMSLADTLDPVRNPHLPVTINTFFSDRCGMSSTEMAGMMSEAQKWKTEADPIDTQAKNMIASMHAMAPGGKLPTGQRPPAVPAALTQLQAQKDAVTMRHVAALQTAWGTPRFKVIDGSLRTQSHPVVVTPK